MSNIANFAVVLLSRVNKKSISDCFARSISISSCDRVRGSNTKSPLEKNGARNVVFVDGVRTPFVHAMGAYSEYMPHDLARIALLGLVNRLGITSDIVEHVVLGILSNDAHTSNAAKDAIVSAGFSDKISAHTLCMACISSNQSMCSAVGLIAAGVYDSVIACGADSVSDATIRLSRPLRQAFLHMTFQARTWQDKLRVLRKAAKWSNLALDIPAPAEYASKELMGHAADRQAAAFRISRKDQDEFALRSHRLTKEATEKGLLSDIVPVRIPSKSEYVDRDNGVRASSLEQLSKLKPSFIKPHGTVTAGNSSFLTDGASACLIMTEDKALELGLKPKAYFRAFVFTAQDPIDQQLLGPVYATPAVLKKAGLQMSDIDVFEFHEAFAGQLLSCFSALDSDYFCKTYLGTQGKYGAPPMEKINLWGGGLAIGHPFGATGIRLASHTANRLIKEDGQFGLISACAQGGQGSGIIMERYPQ